MEHDPFEQLDQELEASAERARAADRAADDAAMRAAAALEAEDWEEFLDAFADAGRALSEFWSTGDDPAAEELAEQLGWSPEDFGADTVEEPGPDL